MSYQLPEKLRNLVPYEPLSGEYKVRLDANESFISLPPAIRAELGDELARIYFRRYPDPNCTKLCEKFGEFFQVPSNLVVAGNGSDELIGLLVSSFTEYGDAMLVVEPDFSMYGFYAQMCGLKVVSLDKRMNGLVLNGDALVEAAKESNAKLVILSNPCNPTSLTVSREEIIAIVQRLNDCLVVIDEAYMDFSKGSVMDLVEKYDNLVVLKTFSKAFGMAAIRLGFAISNLTVVNALKAVKSPYNVNTMTQVAGCVLLGHPDYLKECIYIINKSRDDLYEKLLLLKEKKTQIEEVINTTANFVYVKVYKAQDVFEQLKEKGIAIRFMGDYLRITTGDSQENGLLLEALFKILK